MFSKKQLTIGLAVTSLALGLSACDRFLKSSQTEEERRQQDTIVIKNQDLKCMDSIGDHVKSIMDDRAEAGEIDEVYKCLEKAAHTFTLYTKGADPDSYTGEEIRYFFNRYFLVKTQITPEFMTEIMKLKAFLIGGSTTSMSRAEVGQFLDMAKLLRDGAQDMRGNMRVLFFRDDKIEIDLNKLDVLRARFKTWVRRFVAQAKFAGSMYEFADLNDLMKELHGFLNANPDFEKVEKYMPLAQAAKNLLIGERSDLRTMRDWQAALDWGTDAYFLGIAGYARMRHWDFNLAATSRELIAVAGRVLDLVERAPAFRSVGRLDAGAIDKLVDELQEQKLFLSSVPAPILKDAYRRLIARVLDRNNAEKLNLDDVTGIEKKHLGLLHFELRAWQLSQEHLSEVFEKLPAGQGATQAQLLDGLKTSDVKGKIQGWSDVADAAGLARTWQDWVTALSQPRPMQWTMSGKLLMEPVVADVKSGLRGLTVMNALRPAVRLVMRGYGEGTSAHLWDLQLSEKDLIRLEAEFHEFAMAVKFIDKRSPNPAGRTFKEASFFSYSGDGNQWLTSQETYEELNTLVAVGSGVSLKAFDGAISATDGKCAIDGKEDLFHLKKVNEPCFEKYLRRNFATIMEGVPKLVAEVAKMNDEQWGAFYANFMTIAAVPDKVTGETEYSEIRTALVTLHYVEGLIQIYDVNHDDRMQQAEIVASTPRFRSFIASQSPIGGSMVDTIFLYIVYRGRKPGLGDMFGMPGFQIELARGMRDIGRQDLLKVLAVLKEDASK